MTNVTACFRASQASFATVAGADSKFEEQAVKRAYEVGRIASVAEELGLLEQTLRN